MEDYLAKLNKQQRDAVEYCDGPQLVIAGAGSGKTRVLTYKIVHLLAHGYEPHRILALTFTNKAAREMRERIEQLVGSKTASRLWMGTFHSIFARILRYNAAHIGFRSDFTIYDTADTKSLIKTIIKNMELDDKVYKVSTVMNAISNAKNALVSPQAYAADPDIRAADRRAKRDRIHEIYAAYMNRCHVAGAMDFDDLLYFTNILLRDNPDVRRHYQEFFRYVLVDEYQDTNFAQHLIVSQLSETSRMLCVVGDDAQSIYSFRGANIRNILNLKKSYPTLRIFKLEQNYRSTQSIINAANSLIAKNVSQIPKNVFSKNKVGERIEVVKSYSDFDEAALVANRISQLHLRTGDPYEEFAVLYRTNAQSRVLEESLRKRNIPYRIYGGMSFYQRKEIKDAVAYFRLSINPDDDEALKRVINYPTRGIGDTTVRKLTQAALDHQVSLWQVLINPDTYGTGLNKAALKRLGEFADLINGFIELNTSGGDAYQVATKIISDTGLLKVLISDNTPESISKQENLEELLSGLQEFVNVRLETGDDSHIFMIDFLADVALATDLDEDTGENPNFVTLMTIHAAKGLEFGNVFIVGVEDQLLPSSMCSSPDDIEEERRLLYVAITRAKRFCMMSYANSRFRNGETVITSPSPFLRDIPADQLDYSAGSELGPNRNDPVARYRESFLTQKKPSRSSSPLPTFPIKPSAPAVSTDDAEFTRHSVSELTEGMNIEHPRFGIGCIVGIDTSMPDAKINVKFSNVAVKTLMLKFAKFKII